MSGRMYGMVGWEEFSCNRSDILNKFDLAKAKTKSRKVKVEHGNVVEAAVREWLESYLPKKYGVTSGFIIPDFVELSDPYNLGHFDIIIYDILESPILWVDDNDDKSELGKARAIPAQYVKSVYEVKSNLTAQTGKDVIKKLCELNLMHKFLPEHFSCGAIFIELQEKNINKAAILESFQSSQLPYKFWGGIVLRCSEDTDLIGNIFLSKAPVDELQVKTTTPLIIAGEDMNVVQGVPSGDVVIGPGFGAKATVGPDRKYHFNRSYTAVSHGENYTVNLSWATDNFVTFAIDLIGRLEGKQPMTGESPKYLFGQVFDKLILKSDAEIK
ncbi:hypothetical protein L2737_18505 [Shewanella electrodiphila]|uniref:DUF6602 domain-containing protein n=1 Tax=Shewanella electrodiphila TaxID=934143 RepID=A0ABT0KTW0_9GAMM|nr:DUF6602 domain-containing protein [Shewanella electrodiphila]MCL1047295.1 hypothetical protein [Shewanella electrodiphila]